MQSYLPVFTYKAYLIFQKGKSMIPRKNMQNLIQNC